MDTNHTLRKFSTSNSFLLASCALPAPGPGSSLCAFWQTAMMQVPHWRRMLTETVTGQAAWPKKPV